jgi:ABC-type branched-subunit amino acid transport system substrate-binding protein
MYVMHIGTESDAMLHSCIPAIYSTSIAVIASGPTRVNSCNTVPQVPSDRYQGVAAAGLVARSGSRNVGLVYEDAAYGYGLAFNFIAGFTSGEQRYICG